MSLNMSADDNRSLAGILTPNEAAVLERSHEFCDVTLTVVPDACSLRQANLESPPPPPFPPAPSGTSAALETFASKDVP